MLILKEENELLHIALIRSNAIGYDFKSSECKWSIFDDEIIVRMNSGRCYYFPITSVLYYYVESLEEEPKKEWTEEKLWNSN